MTQLLALPLYRLTDSNGVIIPNGRLYSFVTETLTPAATYTTADLDVSHGNYVEANAAGLLPPIYLDPAVAYRFQIRAVPYSSAVSGMDFDPVTAGTAADITFTQSGSGAVARPVQDKLRENVSPFDFGAEGDATTDDTAAVLAAIASLRSGGTLDLGAYIFKVAQSLVFERPIRIKGSIREKSGFLFAASSEFVTIDTDDFAAMVFLHTNTSQIAGYSGDARSSVLENFNIDLEDGEVDDVRGIVFASPCHAKQVLVQNFTAPGFNVIAGGASPLATSIANNCSFTNCVSHLNVGHGFYFLGNDANDCRVQDGWAAGCVGFGIYDDSLLGGKYSGTEMEDNVDGGFFSSSAKPNRACFFGTYAEAGQLYNLNPRSVVIGPLGDIDNLDGVSLTGIPSGDGWMRTGLAFAATDDIANDNGESPNAGICARIAAGVVDVKPIADGLHVKWGASGSTYVDLTNGANIVMRLPKAAGSGNITTDRALLPQGSVVGSGISGIVGAGTAAPASGTYARGAIWLNETPSGSGKVGWVCTSSGTPGTWKAFGAIDA